MPDADYFLVNIQKLDDSDFKDKLAWIHRAGNKVNRFDLIIVDEAHHVPANQWTNLLTFPGTHYFSRRYSSLPYRLF